MSSCAAQENLPRSHLLVCPRFRQLTFYLLGWSEGKRVRAKLPIGQGKETNLVCLQEMEVQPSSTGDAKPARQTRCQVTTVRCQLVHQAPYRRKSEHQKGSQTSLLDMFRRKVTRHSMFTNDQKAQTIKTCFVLAFHRSDWWHFKTTETATQNNRSGSIQPSRSAPTKKTARSSPRG